MLIDVTRLHTKTILTINGPMKRFPTKDGERERFDIAFTDGYKCEYCPLVAPVQNIPKSGQEITFKVKHRGPKGDEIELAQVESQNSPAQDVSGPVRVFSMSGHPATIALQTAIKLAEINMQQNGKQSMPSEVMEDADAFHEWLLMKANGA